MKDLKETTRSTTEMRDRILADQATHQDVDAAFHRRWYDSFYTHTMTYFEGVPLIKNPLDLWIYQEIIWLLRPTLIIETGTALGGSALFFARQMDRLGCGKVVSIDLDHPAPPRTLPMHPRITWARGSSLDPSILSNVRAAAATHPRVMVSLDSDHSKAHVLAELEAYAPLVTQGQFLVVEDGNIDAPLGIGWKGGPGPGAALQDWLPQHPEFTRDLVAERYVLTCHPGGWLRRDA